MTHNMLRPIFSSEGRLLAASLEQYLDGQT